MSGRYRVGRDSLFHPSFECAQGVERVWARSGHAMLHTGHHEEARILLDFFVASVFLREVLVEPDAAVGRNDQVVVSVVNQQLSALREIGAERRWIVGN